MALGAGRVCEVVVSAGGGLGREPDAGGGGRVEGDADEILAAGQFNACEATAGTCQLPRWMGWRRRARLGGADAKMKERRRTGFTHRLDTGNSAELAGLERAGGGGGSGGTAGEHKQEEGGGGGAHGRQSLVNARRTLALSRFVGAPRKQ